MGSYHMVRCSDGYKTTKSLSVFDVQLQRAFEDHLVAFGAFSEETETVHALAFVKVSGAKPKRGKCRPKIVMEYVDLPEVLPVRRPLEVLVVRRRLQVKPSTAETRPCRCDL